MANKSILTEQQTVCNTTANNTVTSHIVKQRTNENGDETILNLQFQNAGVIETKRLLKQKHD
jgi:hypothetical protein